jgi:hypothetical protein
LRICVLHIGVVAGVVAGVPVPRPSPASLFLWYSQSSCFGEAAEVGVIGRGVWRVIGGFRLGSWGWEGLEGLGGWGVEMLGGLGGLGGSTSSTHTLIEHGGPTKI